MNYLVYGFAAAIFATISLLNTGTGASKQLSPLTQDMSEFRTISKEAYVYGFPMIVAYKVMHDYNINRESGSFRAPFNKIASEARVYTPEDTAVSTPNSDTPYSFIQLDLRAEPMVLCMPEIDPKRYYVVQLTDMYTFNYGYMGSRTTGNEAGCFMVAGPDWEGETPDGIRETFRSETQFTLGIYRTQLFSPPDIENVKQIQSGYSAQPLSAFLGTEAPDPAPAIEWPDFTSDAFTTAFPKYLNFLLQFTPPVGRAAVEKPLREKFARIGIVAGETFDLSSLSAEQQSALSDGIKAANEKIEKTAATVGSTINGWQIGAAAGGREYFNGDWALRAAGAKLGIYGNSQKEAVYPFTRVDGKGETLDTGKYRYTLTFGTGQLPPVNAFWSVTMYDGKTQLLVKNPIDRYLINSPMLPNLKTNDDGSLTFYVQKDSPGVSLEPNWLPAPEGPVFLVMRMYWPKTDAPSIYPLGSGSWAPPPVAKN